MVSGTALVRGCWGRAPGLQSEPEGKSRGAVGLGNLPAPLPAPRARTHCLQPCLYHHPSLPAFLPIPLACTHASACLPACTPCSYPLLALLPAPLPAARFGVRGSNGARAAGRCFRGGGGPCYLPAQRSRNAAAVTGANKDRVRLGGWAAAGTCGHLRRWHRCGRRGKGQGGTVPVPRDGVPLPCTPMLGSQGHVGCPGQCCLPVWVAHACAHVCSPTGSAGAPMGCSNGVQWPRGAHPCTLLGWSPPGLGVRQEEMKLKLSC